MATGLDIHPRDDWGADLPPKHPMGPEDVRFLLVHHTASTNVVPDPRAVIRQTYAFQTGPDKGWPDVCYHFFVGPDGSVWEGRAGSLAGPVVADATGGNQGFAQLVCLIGNFVDQPPTLAAQDSLARLLLFLADRYRIDSDPNATVTFTSRGSNKYRAGAEITTSTISGHRDTSATACPGDQAYVLLPAWRARVERHRLHRTQHRPLRHRHPPRLSPRLKSRTPLPGVGYLEHPRPARNTRRHEIPDSRARESSAGSEGAGRSLSAVNSAVADPPVAVPTWSWSAPGRPGSAAAITLARAGRSVVVLDKAVFPRDKCCGDGLTTLALRELEQLGSRPGGGRRLVRRRRAPRCAHRRAARSWCRCRPTGSTPPSPRACSSTTRSSNSPGRPAPTSATGIAFDGRRPARRPTSVDGARRRLTIDARYVVAADGMWSPVRKALGAGEPGYLGEWHAFRQYARNVTGPAAEQLFVWFEPDLLPGYAWSFPLPNGRANIGFGVLRDGERRIQIMKGLWDDLLQRPARSRGARRPASSSRIATPPGRSRPASTTSRSPAGARCSSATPPRRPT